MKAADLRKSILQAAVQGKLVPQNPHDEPAAVLLEKISIFREKLLKNGYPNSIEAKNQLNKQKKQAIPKDLSDLPCGWTWCTLMSCATLVVDCHNKTAPYVEKGTHLIRTSNIRDGNIVYAGMKYVTQETKHKWSSRCLPQAGDILITREAPMGEICILPLGGDFCLGQRIMLVRINHEMVSSEYLYYFLRNPNFMEYVQDKPVGLTVKHLRVNGVETMLIALPPLAEQIRIATKVNGLMTLCDELETAEKELDSLESQFAEYLPKSILQAAVQGKLVPQNIHDEPADKLLERIKSEKAKLVKNGKLKKEKSLPPIIEDEISYDLPDGWVWCRLGEVISLVSGRDLDLHQINGKNFGIPYITGASAIHNGRVLITRWTEHSCSTSEYGDLLVTCKGTVGKMAFNNVGGVHIARQIMAIRFFSNSLSPEYIKIYIESYVHKLHILAKSIIPGIAREDLLTLPIPLPPLAEQQRIVAKVNALMALCDALKAAHEAPVGNLTAAKMIPFPQPEDEPEMLMAAARGKMPKAPSKALQDARNRLLED